MAVVTTDIEKALGEMVANQEWLPFQRLATRLARQRWPDLVASEPQKDLGADAHASGSVAANGQGKALACSLTPELRKIKEDATQVRAHFPDVKVLIFAIPQPVSNHMAENWAREIHDSFGYELVVVSREDIVSLLREPHNAVICRDMLHIAVDIEPDLTELIARVTSATRAVTANWFAHRRLADQPLIDLQAVRLEQGERRGEILTTAKITDELVEGRRLVLEAPAGRGKTTTLIQLAKLIGDARGLAFLIDLPEWSRSGSDLLDFITGMAPFRASAIDAHDLARVSNVERLSLLFNGWNELSDHSAEVAEKGLRAVDREFPTAGVLVATRAQSIRPPLAGAVRISLLPLTRAQRSEYLRAALGERALELDTAIQNSRGLDDLTRTPFILREITMIFRAGRDLPTTKMGILESVTQLLEETPEHYNDLQRNPLNGNAAAYLSAISIQMMKHADVSISEPEARRVCNSAARELVIEGQITEPPEPGGILEALCAHHVLERFDYPATEFRFEHQQFQEFYAALWLDRELALACQESSDEVADFIKNYVNVLPWDEPLRMIVEKIGADASEPAATSQTIDRGKKLVEMALHVDPIFAADLARLAGDLIWRQVSETLTQRIRAWYGAGDANHKHCALAAMFASGSAEFSDVILPLLTSDDQQVRLATYRAWPEFHLSSLGGDWRKIVGGWQQAARSEFVSELTVTGRRTDVAEYFSLRDPSAEVRIEAVKVLSWIGADDKVAKALESLPEASLHDALLRLRHEDLPPSVLPRALAVYQYQLRTLTDPIERIRIVLAQRDAGETNTVATLKDELLRLPAEKTEAYDENLLRTVVEIIRDTDKQWVSNWVAARIASGSLWHERWVPFVSTIPQTLKNELLEKLGTEKLEHRDRQIIAVLSAVADVTLAQDVFSRLCALRRKMDSSGPITDQIQYAIARQLEDLFRLIPAVAAVGSLAIVFCRDFDATEFSVTTELFSRVGREESDLRSDLPEDLRQRLRSYLKSGVSFASSRTDPGGRLLADLASSLARVGEPEDMADLLALLHADLTRLQQIREARSAGKPVHGVMGWAPWHLQAVISLDRDQAENVLLPLLDEEDYEVDAAKSLLRLATINQREKNIFPGKKNYALLWNARDAQSPARFAEDSRQRASAALTKRITALLEQRAVTGQPDRYTYKLQELAAVLAALDGQNSARLVLEVAALPTRWGGWRQVEALEALIFSGVNVPAEAALGILNPLVERAAATGFHSDQELWLLKSGLCLLPFVDTPGIGISRIREVVLQTRFPRRELPDILSALGYSRSLAALAFLREIAGPGGTGIEYMARPWIDAVANLSGPESRELLLAFLDPSDNAFSPRLTHENHDAERLASRIADMARAESATKQRILRLSDQALVPEQRRLLLKVIAALGTPDVMLAALPVMNDDAGQPVPYELWKAFENLFLEHRPTGTSGNAYAILPRSSNEVRGRLFELVLIDSRRRRSALAMLGQIEVWHLENGKPSNEPRHPALEFGLAWPPLDLF
jgi:hypothetical protein